MQARVERRGQVVVIHLSGRIDYESADKFRKTCLETLTKEKVVFNLEKLSFVGSSGITPFVETMMALSIQTEGGIKFCRVGSEFKKIFESSALKAIEIFDNPDAATTAYQAYPLGAADYNFVDNESVIDPSINKDFEIEE